MAEQWEYMSVALDWDDKSNQYIVTGPWGKGQGEDSLGASLNPLGDQGWELVSLFVVAWNTRAWGEYPTSNSYCAILKRRKP